MAGSTYGWGVVFWEDLLEEFRANDVESAREIEETAFRWVNQVVDIQGRRALHAGGHGYSINRRRLLDILAGRAERLGVHTHFEEEVTDPFQLSDVDLIVACNGANSQLRRLGAERFQTEVHLSRNKYIWLGTNKVFDAFTFPFVHTDCGWIWAHAYGIDAQSSTFIVECSTETWTGLGFDTMTAHDSLAVLENIFERPLGGHSLFGRVRANANVPWLNFRTVTNKHWYDEKTVLMGDAAHTTHFTIGSGTKLAIGDAIALAEHLQRHGELATALASYENERRAALLPLQSEAHFSAQWFENISRYIDLEPHQFLALLRERRSPLLPHLSPQLYYRFHQVMEEVSILREIRKRVGPKARALYSRRRAALPNNGPRDRTS